MKDSHTQRGRPRRVTIGNLLLMVGALVLLTPLAFMAYEEIAYRLEMSRAPQPSPVLLTPVGEAAVQPLPPPTSTESTAEPSDTGKQGTTTAPAQPDQPTEPAQTAPLPPPGDLPVLQFDREQPIPVYQLEIPRLGTTYLVGEGIEDPVLAKGPGHYPQTVLPGEAGTAALAGHRTIRGKPAFFYAINKLEPGDTLRIGYRDKSLTFRVERVFLTTPHDLSVLSPTPYPSLTLTTCDPPGSDEMRLIVQSRLVQVSDNP